MDFRPRRRRESSGTWSIVVLVASLLEPCGQLLAADPPPPFPKDPGQHLERTCFQTGQAWSELGNLRSDVAIVYGIDSGLPERIQTWRSRGYSIHVMTGVSWGNYQDYLYGRFDGVNHENEAQTERNGNKISHGGDVYYMSPGTNYGKFLCVGVQRALDAGAEAIHLEEPEFWVRGGYSEGFKREWREHYHEDWQPPHESVDAQWRASKLKYFLYRRALQQVFDHVKAYNLREGRKVRCYVPTHSLLNYAHWRIVSPESSLAHIDGCDGYIAQVWTGTSRTPNRYRGELRERTFETAFLEYGAMQNLVRSTGRTVWYLNDPIEDDPRHDWEDYRRNWESTLVASLFQPEVWRFEVAPWPERIFEGKYPRGSSDPQAIPSAYAAELQIVMNALHDMNQSEIEWDCGTPNTGFVVSDSLMFQRGDPSPSDAHMSHVYGMALPLLKRGSPVTPVQLENLRSASDLKGIRLLFLTYTGMKPLTPEVHRPLVDWMRQGGGLIIVDDDRDPFNNVREWWNSGAMRYATPREHLVDECKFTSEQRDAVARGETVRLDKGWLRWWRVNPAELAASKDGDEQVRDAAHAMADRVGLSWRETAHLVLRRGPYLIAAGLDERIAGAPWSCRGHFVNLFDPELRVRDKVQVGPGSRWFLMDLEKANKGGPGFIASSCKSLVVKFDEGAAQLWVEGVARTPGLVLLRVPRAPAAVTLSGKALGTEALSYESGLLWIRFENESAPRKLEVRF